MFEKNPDESTVIALGDESLLHPTLSTLPSKELPWNITMGYPLKRTPFADFFLTLFELLEHDEDSGYPLLLVKELMHIVYVDSILDQKGSKIKAILKDFEQSNRLFIASKILTQGGEIQKIIFSPFKNISIFLERMMQLTNAIQEYYLVND